MYCTVIGLVFCVLRSEFALLYNDRAVLENHHVSSVFRLLQNDDLNVLAALKPEEHK